MGTAEVASLTERRQRAGRGGKGPSGPDPARPGAVPDPARVAVLHGDAGVRTRLSAHLAADDLDLAGAVASVAACLALAPHVVVVLHGVPGTSAMDQCERLRAGADAPAVVVVANEPRAVLLRRAVQCGATGFVDAASPPDVLRAAVRAAAARRPFFDPAVARFLVELIGRTPNTERPYGLTPAQLDVVALLPRGLPNRLIAAELGISENTVKTHLRHALRKLGVRDRAQAAALVVREGLA